MSDYAKALAEARRLKAIILKHGVPEVSIELRPGRPNSYGQWFALYPVSEMSHHTVSRYSASNLTPVLSLCKYGRSDLPGPLCNGYGGWDLTYRIITMGYANHPGAGGPLTVPTRNGRGYTIPRDSARRYAWGTEYEGGLSEADWTRTLKNPRNGKTMTFREFMGRANAALNEYLEIVHGAHLEHSSWTSRKIDRLGYTRAEGIAELERYAIKEPPKPDPKPDPKPERWVPYDVAYWNGGQRPADDLVKAWTLLLKEAAVLHVSEVADQVPALRRLEAAGFGLVLGPDGVPDGRKEAILYDAKRLKPKGKPTLTKVGNTFRGRRHGRKGTVRMANKYVLAQEFVDTYTGWTPTHGVTHVWPSVTLNQPQVRGMVGNVAEWVESVKGSLFLMLDANMVPGHALAKALRETDLVWSQLRYGPDGTWGPRAIDWGLGRESGHYRMTGQDTIRLPGREKGGKAGHKAVVVRGEMRVR